MYSRLDSNQRPAAYKADASDQLSYWSIIAVPLLRPAQEALRDVIIRYQQVRDNNEAGKPQGCKSGNSFLRIGGPSRLPYTYPYTGQESLCVSAGDV